MSQRARLLIEGFDLSGFRQHVSEPTRGDNYLGLVFTKSAEVSSALSDPASFILITMRLFVAFPSRRPGPRWSIALPLLTIKELILKV